MKKITFMTMAIIATTLFSCSNKTKQAETKTLQITQNEEGLLPIAYVNVDSIIANYTFAVEANEKLIKKQEDARLNINSKAKQLQSEMAEFQRKLENNAFLSRERAEQEAQRLQKRETELQGLDQKLTQELVAEQQAVSEQLRENINKAIKEFNKDGRYHFILSTSTMQDNVLYAIEGYDISKDILEILNSASKK